MLVVRKEGKAHAQYNSFRSAFELLASARREPLDGFEETEADIAPLQILQQKVSSLMELMKIVKQSRATTGDVLSVQKLQEQMRELEEQHQQQIQKLEQMQQKQQQQIRALQEQVLVIQIENKTLQSQLDVKATLGTDLI